MKKNVDAMLEVKNAILNHPGQHDQSSFSSNHTKNPLDDCGTTCCVAGWALAVNGMTLDQVFTADSLVSSISDKAAELLGLTYAEGQALFYDTLDDEDDAEKAALDLLDEYIEQGKNGL